MPSNPKMTASKAKELKSAFSLEDAERLTAAVGLPLLVSEFARNADVEEELPGDDLAQLARKLNDAAVNWGWLLLQQTKPTNNAQLSLASSVAKDCARLLGRLTDNEGNLAGGLGPGGLWAQAALEGERSGKKAVNDAIGEISRLQRWSEKMADRVPSSTEPAKRQPDKAFDALLRDLGLIYRDCWQRTPGLSRDQMNVPRGPFFRFAMAAIEHLGIERGDEALASKISKLPELAAIRAHGANPFDEWGNQ